MKKRILTVDDEIHLLKLLERIIVEKTDHDIVVVENSLEVPKILQYEQFDLIITDLKMPGLNGLDILKMVRQQNRAEEVIIITAFGSLETALRAFSLGVFDYIQKPFKKELIIDAINRALKEADDKLENKEMAAVFNLEPFSSALESFKKTYLTRLLDRSNRQKDDMIYRSGLSETEINEMLNSSSIIFN